jgi:Family of unknown function (DUF5681)
MMQSAKTGEQQAGRFRKGQSGNPAGRPRGSRHSATLAAEALLEGEAEKLTRKCIELALAGDTVALRLCIERICPPRKDRPVSFPLPSINTARDAADVMSSVMSAVAAGQITPNDAAEISKVIAVAVKAYEIAEVNDGTDWTKRLTLAELHRIAAGGTPPRLTINAHNQR